MYGRQCGCHNKLMTEQSLKDHKIEIGLKENLINYNANKRGRNKIVNTWKKEME